MKMLHREAGCKIGEMDLPLVMDAFEHDDLNSKTDLQIRMGYENGSHIGTDITISMEEGDAHKLGQWLIKRCRAYPDES